MIDKKQVKDLQEELNCTAYEAYRLLVEIERNEILKEGLGTGSNTNATNLEAIGIALGFSRDDLGTTLTENLSIIADNVESLGTLIDKLNEKYGD